MNRKEINELMRDLDDRNSESPIEVAAAALCFAVIVLIILFM